MFPANLSVADVSRQPLGRGRFPPTSRPRTFPNNLSAADVSRQPLGRGCFPPTSRLQTFPANLSAADVSRQPLGRGRFPPTSRLRLLSSRRLYECSFLRSKDAKRTIREPSVVLRAMHPDRFHTADLKLQMFDL
ncbi:hypothetical protein PAMA_015665 [Pampus argenteus]